MKSIKPLTQIYIGLMIFSLSYGAFMLVTMFFQPCDEGRGSSLLCDMPIGSEAIIDAPAEVEFSARENFTVEQHNQEGDVIIHEPINESGRRSLTIITNQPTTWFMTKEEGGFDVPMIYINRIAADQNPSLFVHRTWYKPLMQLVLWNQFLGFTIFPLLALLNFLYAWKEQTKS